MYLPFFPGPVFAWAFLGALLAILVAATSTDLRRMVVPKWITLPALVLGLLLNVLRGAWLGGSGQETWLLGESNALVGGLDGLLFAVAGFATGFGLFFLMWVLGACGGGDVKLFAAVGTWVGPLMAVGILGASVALVFLVVLARAVMRLVQGDFTALRPGPRGRDGKPIVSKRSKALGFALPLAIATALVLLWEFRVDLRFVAAPHAAGAKGETHAN